MTSKALFPLLALGGLLWLVKADRDPGLILAAFVGFIDQTGQMSAWRWYFRFISLLAIPFSYVSYIYIPSSPPTFPHSTTSEKWRRFDVPGCAVMLGATLLFILSLTLGATYGWKTAKFLVPFLLCWPVGVGFVFWERTLKEGYALVPPSTWRIRNVSLLLVIALSAFAYWPVSRVLPHSILPVNSMAMGHR